MKQNGVIILGGGPAGVAAAYYAAKAGRPVQLLEAGPKLGGNARTETYSEFRFDAGAHRFHDKDPAITEEVRGLLGEDFVEVDSPSRILNRGRFYDFPLSLKNLLTTLEPGALLRGGLEAIGQKLRPPSLEGTDTVEPNFQSLVVRQYGASLARRFVLDYSEKLWGERADHLAVEVGGGRLRALSPSTLLSELLGRRKTDHLEGRFYYPRNGFGSIFDAMAATLPRGSVRLRARCASIRLEGKTAVEIHVESDSGSDVIPVDGRTVVTSLPLPTLVRMTDGLGLDGDLRRQVDALAFRDLALLGLVLERPRVSANASIYFSDPDLPFTRLHEPKNRSSALAPSQRTLVLVEFPCFHTDPVWNEEVGSLARRTAEQLAGVGLFREEEVRDSFLIRSRSAYPILKVGDEKTIAHSLAAIRSTTNLIPLGRAALFDYLHTHEILGRARELF